MKARHIRWHVVKHLRPYNTSKLIKSQDAVTATIIWKTVPNDTWARRKSHAERLKLLLLQRISNHRDSVQNSTTVSVRIQERKKDFDTHAYSWSTRPSAPQSVTEGPPTSPVFTCTEPCKPLHRSQVVVDPGHRRDLQKRHSSAKGHREVKGYLKLKREETRK